jgi:hypothetical protein
VHLTGVAGVEGAPDGVEDSAAFEAEGLPELRDEGKPADGPLVSKHLLEGLPFELLEEDAVFVERLSLVLGTFSNWRGEIHPLCSGSCLAQLL